MKRGYLGRGNVMFALFATVYIHYMMTFFVTIFSSLFYLKVY